MLDEFISTIDSIGLPPITDNASADKAQRLMQLRRQMIERVHGVRQAQALQVRGNATLMSLEESRKKAGVNAPAQEDLNGREIEAQANISYYQDMIGQHLLELKMLKAMLIGE